MRDASADRSGVVVLGATGHIGSAVVRGLRDHRVPVRAVTRSPRRAEELRAAGAEAVVGDLLDPATLRRALETDAPARVFALNPPGPVTGDPDAEEGATAAAIAAGLAAADVERVVALSTYGARAGERIGDLGTLHRFETLLRDLPAPVAVLRAGYLYSNWDGAVDAARDGRLPVMLHPDRPLPMVAPVDVAREAVRLLTLPVPSTAVHSSEGPERLSPMDVAAVLARALGRPVHVDRTREEEWPAAFEAAGFSPEAVRSFVGLTAAVDREDWDLDHEPVLGTETLAAYVERLLA